MKAKTQKNIGLATAGIMLIIGIYQLFFSVHSLPTLLGLLKAIILSALYVFALSKKKLKVAQIVFWLWWFTGVIVYGVIFLIIIVAGRWAESFQSAFTVLMILFCLVFPFGVMTFLWWIGLRGLKRIVDEQNNK